MKVTLAKDRETCQLLYTGYIMKARDVRPWLENTELIGGAPCLDFVNSVADCIGPDPVEQLRSYPELLFWLGRCGLLADNESRRLLKQAKLCPDEAARVLKRALRFRDGARRVLTAVATGDTPAPADLDAVNRRVREAHAHLTIVPAGEGFHMMYGTPDDLEQPLRQAARALVDFLVSDDLLRLRMCASDTCGWLFVDRSRNHLRRWCSMRDCGNLAKQRRHRARRE